MGDVRPVAPTLRAWGAHADVERGQRDEPCDDAAHECPQHDHGLRRERACGEGAHEYPQHVHRLPREWVCQAAIQRRAWLPIESAERPLGSRGADATGAQGRWGRQVRPCGSALVPGAGRFGRAHRALPWRCGRARDHRPQRPKHPAVAAKSSPGRAGTERVGPDPAYWDAQPRGARLQAGRARPRQHVATRRSLGTRQVHRAFLRKRRGGCQG
mmetsp:Transcript_42699/g.117842  ORF Transcript_42699/g.117842 Transcript_42699/m.117842 type:complete len:214 (-) Transcript_42699:599-1240(-)